VVLATVTETLGIDLASKARLTAACVVEWTTGAARVAELCEGLEDDALLRLIAQRPVTKVGIDAPFGWPQPFVAAVVEYTTSGRWPPVDRRALTLRATDQYAWAITGRQPLSVAADRIAHTAFRCAELLTKVGTEGPIDRAGSGLVAEVYPAAALAAWGLTFRGYKGVGGLRTHAKLLLELQGACSPWLELHPEHQVLLANSDHLLDAFVAALIARAVETASCVPIPDEHLEAAKTEGWIHLPASPLSEVFSAATVGLP
jgi:hypothetical protein